MPVGVSFLALDINHRVLVYRQRIFKQAMATHLTMGGGGREENGGAAHGVPSNAGNGGGGEGGLHFFIKNFSTDSFSWIIFHQELTNEGPNAYKSDNEYELTRLEK